MRFTVGLALTLAACTDAAAPSRDQIVIATLAEDNYVWALREPELVAMKMTLIQQSSFEWLRGTARLYWRDITTVGTDRPGASLGDAASSRVLLVGDPHPENIGTFLTPDGTQVVDWDDFDAAGYGPFQGDVRRLAAGLIIAADDDALAPELARQVGLGYVEQIQALAAGKPVAAVGIGAEPYLDKLLAKALKKGGAHATIDEIAPIANGARQIAFGDIDPVPADGVIAKRLAPVGAEAAASIDRAIATWQPSSSLTPAEARVVLRTRRIGAGVASYPLLRYYAILAGPSDAPEDDIAVELKEERDGLIITGVPQWTAGEWATPARRVVDAQRRLNARPDEDVLNGAGEAGVLSLRIHNEIGYQKGVSAADLAALAADPAHRDEVPALAHRFGMLLARAHGNTTTADGVLGWTVITPVLDAGFVADLVTAATADATAILADYASFKDRDLASLVLPLVKE